MNTMQALEVEVNELMAQEGEHKLWETAALIQLAEMKGLIKASPSVRAMEELIAADVAHRIARIAYSRNV